ncbi:MAG: folP, partial [Planctomycetaceae bacterium]|nr:folP [Planctomycetaceae bacterium]
WLVGTQRLQLGQRPMFMGILNVTPDSFSDGGMYTSINDAMTQAELLIAQGADILDIGGESTRPGSAPVTLDEELQRVIPLIQALAGRITVPISIDTTKSQVARQAIQAGASIVNDISGLTFDSEMPRVCAESGAGVIVMHIQGTPLTMQANPHYDDVVEEVRTALAQRIEALVTAGIRQEAIVTDPGLGFGKSAHHNLELLAGIPRLRDLGRPVLIGHSRKRFLGKILGRPVDERSLGTVGVSLAAVQLGADILRLHEITPSRECWMAWNAVMQAGNAKQAD